VSSLRRFRARLCVQTTVVVVVFDAMGTLFDLSALDEQFVQRGAAAVAREAWFERLLDTTKALTMVGEFVPFGELAVSTLRTTLAGQGIDPDEATQIVDALARVPAYPEARDALDAIDAAGLRAVVLTNGGAAQTKQLLAQAELEVERVFTTEEVKAYKPDPRPYRHVCDELGIAPSDATLVAAHGWDVTGARAAGYDTIWIDRTEKCWPLPGDEPARRAPDLAAAAQLLVQR
jgi:2-haloacid dehalogenase